MYDGENLQLGADSSSFSISHDSLTFSPPVIFLNWHWPINQWSFVFWIRTCLSDKMAQPILEKQACQLWPWPIGVKENLAQDAATPGQNQVHNPNPASVCSGLLQMHVCIDHNSGVYLQFAMIWFAYNCKPKTRELGLTTFWLIIFM